MTKRPLTVGSLKAGEQRVESTERTTQEQEKLIVKEPAPKASVQFIQNNTAYQVIPEKGKTLLGAALEQNQTVDYKCTKGSCGRCAVKLVNGGDFLLTLNEKEMERLKGLAGEGYRLACQAVFK